jgi:hypothetical protein
VLPDVEGYVILQCARCKDQFYIPKKKGETQEDTGRWYSQFLFCAFCAQMPKSNMVLHAKVNNNWAPGQWDPRKHDAGLLKP